MTSVPICPSAAASELECFVLSRGWIWSRESLRTTLYWLQKEAILCERDFVGLCDINELEIANFIEPEIKTFLNDLAKVCQLCPSLSPACLILVVCAGCRQECEEKVTLQVHSSSLLCLLFAFCIGLVYKITEYQGL